MNVTIKTLGFNAKPDLKDFVHEKAGKLSRFYDKIIECEVSFSIDKSSTKENKVCDIKLSIPGNDLIAKAQCKTFEEATSQCLDALHRQIEKKKTKLTAH